MDMTAKSVLIRKMRSERMWSQEQLGEACGLSLRTIQRLESSGNASMETIKALASVLEVEPIDLYWRDGGFEVYKHVQRADYILIALLLTGAVVFTFALESTPVSFVFIGIVVGIMAIIAVLFYSLTIEVNEHNIVWHFGMGFWQKTVPLEEIDACRSVRNPIWWGFGIRTFGTGWLYNVSGLLAVEIDLASGAILRLGTDEPKYLKQAIDDAKSNAL